MKTLKVKDHNNYRLFDYKNEQSNTYQLGDIVCKKGGRYNKPEIGIVIQTFSDGEFRTDMFGMSYKDEVRAAKMIDIIKYRPSIQYDIN